MSTLQSKRQRTRRRSSKIRQMIKNKATVSSGQGYKPSASYNASAHIHANIQICMYAYTQLHIITIRTRAHEKPHAPASCPVYVVRQITRMSFSVFHHQCLGLSDTECTMERSKSADTCKMYIMELRNLRFEKPCRIRGAPRTRDCVIRQTWHLVNDMRMLGCSSCCAKASRISGH